MNTAGWWGLRTRLLLAFGLLGLVTTTVVAGVLYWQARNVILQTSQDAAAVALTDQVATLFPLTSLPPSGPELERVADALSDRDSAAVVLFRGRPITAGRDMDLATPELRAVVASGRVAWQRVTRSGAPALVIGTQLRIKNANGPDVPTGVEIYVFRSLEAERASVEQLTLAAVVTGGVSLGLALLLAWIAARGVLVPVRELHGAARRLGEGDLTARVDVRGADELAEVGRTFNSTAQALENQVGELRRMEADARRFVADVSHELRTPLAAMTAVTDVLDEEADRLPGDAGTAARLVSRETSNLTRVVNDLIEVTRFDSGVAALALDDVDVADAVRATLRARGWTDTVQADLPGGVMARLDPRRLDVVMANLVGNAVRHGAPPVSVRLWADGEWIVLEVTDSGPGLDTAVLPHVFDRFYKADTARGRSEGSGLGLAIAWENARLHRDGDRVGSLTAGNRPEGGAVFTLRLPRHSRMAGEDT
ncbi:sensor histidine kinase [Amycolatopsis suaedae]|uniref:sensor histidine kinase n=1 Tax=Amycolatopsis suaedae TaxID=2510978 RepID=UPI00196A8D66|nr:HAMP domain-containing sensor histidine kinase [Amycolatopsis suaedae]